MKVVWSVVPCSGRNDENFDILLDEEWKLKYDDVGVRGCILIEEHFKLVKEYRVMDPV